MRVSQLLLSALLNACWQIILIFACASVCAWLLRSTAARYRHALWVAALLLSIGLPLSTSAPLSDALAQLRPAPEFEAEPVSIELRAKTEIISEPVTAKTASSSFVTINAKLAWILLFVYAGLVVFSTTRLILAWRRTRRIIRDALPVVADGRVDRIVENCKVAIGVQSVEVLSSTSIPVPITAGFLRPAIIIPTKLLTDPNDELLTSGIAHELIHVRRRDYLLNLVYELIFLPLSFHPAAALIRRRISQTRELSCDELVAEKVQSAQVYARSLVQLAAWAPPLGRLAKSTTVGIADADNLEARVMSLLKNSKPKSRRRVVLLLAASLVLALPIVAAASFALQFDIDPQGGQEPKLEAFVTPMPEYTEDARAQKIEGTVGMLVTIDPNGGVRNVEVIKPLFPSLDKNAVATVRKWQFPPYVVDGNPVERRVTTTINFNLNQTQIQEKSSDQQEQAMREDRKRLEQKQREAASQDALGYGRSAGAGASYSSDSESAAKAAQQDAELGYRRVLEVEARAKAQAELARHVRISMDQAIQIATSKYPGTVMEGTLVAERWESTGVLAKDSDVWYHLRVLQRDDDETIVHVWVSATDGHIVKTEKEKQRQAESGPGRKAIRGGLLNGRAQSLPAPEYPAIARAAGAKGMVVVDVVIDEAGNVVEARAVSGHPLLQSAAVTASRQARFAPTRLQGQPVKVRGSLTYNFVKD